ncbi:hypothetical protein GCM10007242_50400 [Pigmentiphaga litoralis]|uniref:DUF6587 family protein n=1 Tax=Pigmentiphaga litoralis TaxID=516702 RepID=UPI001677E0A5|nr:DUF6587 family protein [Pigmentiphaga litoralis]GGX36762.1 hypothetical protein GCM10007242_50400 [Pigmentiphaga litoralis]
MTAYSTFESLIVGLVVLACALGAFRRMMPKTHARLKQRAGDWMARGGHPAWMQSVGHRWAARKVDAGGCGSGCGTCDNCGTSSDAATMPSARVDPAATVRPVKLVKRESL